MVCKMAIVLLPPLLLPNRTSNCKSDSVGMANLAKLCQTNSPSETRALSGKQSRKECWLRPIAVLDGKERHALRVLSALKSSPYAHSPASLTCVSRNARMLCNSCLNEQASSQPHSPFHSWAKCSATHCGSAVKTP